VNTEAIFARQMLYAVVTMVIGSVGARWMESPSLPARESPPASRQGMWAWTVVLVALLVLFVMQFLALELAPTAQDVAMLLRQTAWGHGWLILAGAALMGALAHLARLPLLLRTVAVAGVALAMGGLGHAAADESLMIGRSSTPSTWREWAWIGTLLCAPVRRRRSGGRDSVARQPQRLRWWCSPVSARHFAEWGWRASATSCRATTVGCSSRKR
jgi:putative copper export protein